MRMTTTMGNAMSKRVLGVGIVAFGGLILAIGLIIGLEFPKYVYRRSLRDVCILQTSHEEFPNWVTDTYRNKTNRLYFWEVVNADDFLYKGSFPKVQQRGPYIYNETTKKVNIRFVKSSHYIAFREVSYQTFDSRLTQQECGVTCTEYDEITVLNKPYLDTVAINGGVTNYALMKLPATIFADIEQISTNTTNQSHSAMLMLGSLTSAVDDQLRVLLQYPAENSSYSFASWLRTDNSSDAAIVLTSRSWEDFTVKEMFGLYEALSNQELFGAHNLVLTDDNLLRCDKFNSEPNLQNVSYHFFPYHRPSLHEISSSESMTAPCGLAYFVRMFANRQYAESYRDKLSISNIIQHYICTNIDESCLMLPEAWETRTAFINVLHNFIFNHLLENVFQKAVVGKIGDVITRSDQRSLALGFYRTNSATNATIFVPGILPHDDFLSESDANGKQMAVFNCFNALEATTNFMWHSYEGKIRASFEQFPGATDEERMIFSSWTNLPPCKNVTACKRCDLPQQTYDFFLPPFWRRLKFSRTSDTKLRGISLRRLSFNQSNLMPDRVFVGSAGLQEMTGTYGYLSWMSLPHYLFSNKSFFSLFNMTPSQDAHRPYVDVEPITGAIWRARLTHQFSGALRGSDITVPRYKKLNISHLLSPVPIYWLDHSFVFNELGRSKYNSEVETLLKTSCGGLIGLCVVASLLMLTGILAATVTVRDGRIYPIEIDQMSLY